MISRNATSGERGFSVGGSCSGEVAEPYLKYRSERCFARSGLRGLWNRSEVLGLRFSGFGVVEPPIVDSQAAIFGLGEHIGETVAPQHLVREIGGAGVDGL
jgi:hypothetical protein